MFARLVLRFHHPINALPFFCDRRRTRVRRDTSPSRQQTARFRTLSVLALLVCAALLVMGTFGAPGLSAQTQPTSITVSPLNPMLNPSQTQQFTAQSGTTLNLGEGGAVAAGYEHTCALLSDGTVRCWGSNQFNQLGNGTAINSSTQVAVSGLSGVTAIAAGEVHTCALLSDGTVKCWGNNAKSQLGDGSTINRTTPVAVSGLSGATAIAAGSSHSCALLSGGTVKCWGDNTTGELGNGSTTSSSTPVAVSGLSGATAIASGGGGLAQDTCALLSNGTVKCWGQNNVGQLGNGSNTNSSTPVAVTGLSGATAIAVGDQHTCALLSDGTAKCWGYGAWGQLGNGSTTGSFTPVAVTGLSGATAVAAGFFHSCALLSNGTVQCWGYNSNGQLGDGTTTNRLTPVAVSSLSGATAIAAGYEHTCALVSDGTMKCWGYNAVGQLGGGTLADSTTPVTVTGGSALPGRGASQIQAASFHTCALQSDGTVQCWGINREGGRGNGKETGSISPVAVT